MIGLDGFTITPDTNGVSLWNAKGVIRPVTSHGLTSGSVAPGMPSLVGDKGEWSFCKQQKLNSTTYDVFAHMDTGITIGIWQDGGILFVSGNVSRLIRGVKHNGWIAADPAFLHKCIQKVKATISPVLQNPADDSYSISSLEFGGVVKQPFSTFWSLLSWMNYPGLQKAPKLNPGESMKFGTSDYSEFILRLYDKGIELNGKYNLSLPENTYTRIEIVLRKKKLHDAFGGGKLEGLTRETMQEEFFRRVYKMLPAPVANVNVLPVTKPGLLANSLLRCEEDPEKLQQTKEWWLQSYNHSQRSKAVLKEAMMLYQSVQNISLQSLIPMDSPCIHLPPEEPGLV